MDILLINAPVKKVSRHASLSPPLGLAYVASVLIGAGYSVSAIDFNVSGFNPLRLKRLLEREAPRILGVSAHTETYLSGLKIAEIAKQVNPKIMVVMGGPHATVMYQDVARERDVDVVVRGEGEYTMLDLVHTLQRKLDMGKVLGISYRQ